MRHREKRTQRMCQNAACSLNQEGPGTLERSYYWDRKKLLPGEGSKESEEDSTRVEIGR